MTINNYGLFSLYTPTHLPDTDIRIQLGGKFVKSANGQDWYDLRNALEATNSELTYLVVIPNGVIRVADNDVTKLFPWDHLFVTIPRVADPKALQRKVINLQTGEISDPPSAPVTRVSKLQGKLALLDAGLLDDAEAAISAAGGAVQLWYADALTWVRDDPIIIQIAAALNLSSAQVDSLFEVASTK